MPHRRERLRAGMSALLHRNTSFSKQRKRADSAPVIGHNPPEEGRSSKRQSFTVLRAQVYKKAEHNNFKYSPMLAARVPVIRVDPPDNVPFEMKLEELHITTGDTDAELTPPGSPVPSGDGGAKLCIVPIHAAPPHTPPDSPVEVASPTRAPPPPPLPHPPPRGHLTCLSDDILLRIYTHAPDLSAVCALSQVNRRLHSVYSSASLTILQTVLARTSPAAHRYLALLQTSYTPATYAEYYSIVTDTVRTFSALIRARCTYLAPTNPFDTEQALFNVWSYCTLFTPATDERPQEAWLGAFASAGQVFDMLMVWNCIAVLLHPFLREERLARMYGVVGTPADEVGAQAKVLAELEGFVEALLVRGLDTLLPIVRWGEEEHNQRYAIVVAKGLHRVDKDCGGTFLKQVAKRVYMRLCAQDGKGERRSSGGGGWGPTFEV